MTEPKDRSRTRSLVASAAGAIASESVLATQVGARVLEGGGNAIDAAVAANAVLGLVAPMNNGIGGDLFAIIYEAASGTLHGLNASGWAPGRLSPELLDRLGIREMPQSGIHSVTVPGAVEGWDRMLQRFGSQPLRALLAPAIHYAESGFPVEEVVQDYWLAAVPTLRRDPASARTYLPAGRAPETGERFTNPELAWTYRELAAGGRDAFYCGTVAERILATSRLHEGTLEPHDLAEFSAEWVEPVTTRYRDWTVSELPPNGQGIAALEMLNILEQFPLASWGHNSVRSLHVMIEAKKLAYADLIRYVGDMRHGPIPVAELIDRKFAAARAAAIDPARAASLVTAGRLCGTDHGTTYLAAADRFGNLVSLIQSNFAATSFGSGIAVAGAGFVLQNRGGLFVLVPGHPNVLAGRKRSLHTIIPGFMQRGEERIAFGIMGGWNQAQAHAQFVANVADFDLNLQAALDAPRFSKDTFDGVDVYLEARIGPDVRRGLAELGHEVMLRGDFCSVKMGCGQAVSWNPQHRVFFGASDARKDGAALGALEQW